MKRLVKFSVVGIGNTIITTGTYALLLFSGVHYLTANVIGYSLGMLNSFYWNKHWVFKTDTDRAFIKFVMVNMIALMINNMILFFLVNGFHVHKFFAQLFATGAGFIFNFFLNKNWTFAPK